MRRVLLSLLFASATVGSIFRVKTPAGIDFVHQNSPTANKYLIETMGGGVALLDYDQDGLLDIFLVNSGYLSDEQKTESNYNRHDQKYWNRLYRQNKDGSFTDVTKLSGLANEDDHNYGMGVAVADYDNDGYPDIYVTNYGKNTLYHNNRNGTYSDVTSKAGVAAGGWSVSAGFFDYDNDGYLDLFVTRYVEWSEDGSKVCGGNFRTYCPPSEFRPTTNILYHNNHDGTFTDVSEISGVSSIKGRSLGVAFDDYDGDGFSDIFVANDGMEEFLFHNNGNGTFTEKAVQAGVALNDDGGAYAGMGVVFDDYDNDGKPDIIVTNLANQVYALYHNEGDGLFSYRSLQAGLVQATASSSGWGVGLVDFNNDGWKDLFVAQGHVMDNVESIDHELHYKQVPLLALNAGGRFEVSDPGTATPIAGRGAAFGDINNDGRMDAVVSALGASPQFFYNQAKLPPEGNHWLTLTLEGKRSNRDGIGARVMVNGQRQYVSTSGSYLSANDKRVHFGLGSATSATVDVFWPSRTHQTLKNVHADQFLKIEEPLRP